MSVAAFAKSGSFTFLAAHADAIGTFTPTAEMTATIPANTSVAFAINTLIGLVNNSGQTVTVAAVSGVSLLGPGYSTAITIGPYESGTILKTSTNGWVFSP